MYSIESAHRCREAAILKQFRFVGPALLPVVLALCAVLQLIQISRSTFRTIHDDGIYLTTAKALAAGKGYVIDSLPEPMAQTKYPILFPAMLAAVWKVAPEFPANLPFLRLVPLMCMWGWLYLLWKLLGDALGMREQAKWIIALLISAPLLGLFVRMPLSEMPFAFFSTWAMLILTRIHVDPAPPSMRRILLLGLAFALAYHTRTAALAVLPVVALTLARKKAWSGLALFGLLAVGAWAPWAYWQQIHPPPTDEVLRFYTYANYSDWNLLSSGRAAEPLQVTVWNALSATTWPRDLWALQIPGWLMPAYLVVAAVTARGLLVLLRGSGSDAALWTVSNTAMILLWPWVPLRFLVPVLPILLLALTAAVPERASGTVRGLARGAAAVLVLMGMWFSSRPENQPIWPEYAQLFDWLRTSTDNRAIIAGSLDPSYWLYANRKSIRPYEYDPVRTFYQLREERSTEEDARHLERVLQTHRVEYLVFDDTPTVPETEIFRRQLESLQANRKGLLEPLFATPSGKIRVFRVRQDKLRQPRSSQSDFPSSGGAIRRLR